MKSFFLSVFCGALIASTSYANKSADSELLTNSNATPYESIQSWYSQASQIQYSSVKDSVYDGRCFDVVKPNEPSNETLVFRSKIVKNNLGPAFPPITENKVAILSGYYKSKAKAFAVTDDGWEYFQTQLNLNSNLEFSLVENGNLLEYGEVKKYGNYFVYLSLAGSDIKCGHHTPDSAKHLCNSLGFIERGTTIASCYFFKQIN